MLDTCLLTILSLKLKSRTFIFYLILETHTPTPKPAVSCVCVLRCGDIIDLPIMQCAHTFSSQSRALLRSGS